MPHVRDANNDLHDGHKWIAVHQHMVMTVAREYRAIGNALDLPRSRIVMLYGGLRGELKARTKPPPKG